MDRYTQLLDLLEYAQDIGDEDIADTIRAELSELEGERPRQAFKRAA